MYSIWGGTGSQRELGEVERGWGGEQPREEQSRNCSAAQVGLQSPSAPSSYSILLLSSSQVLTGIDQLSWAKSNEDEISMAICSVLPPPKSMEFGRALSSLPLNLGSSHRCAGTVHSGTEKLGPLCTSILALQLTSSAQAWSGPVPESAVFTHHCQLLCCPAGKVWSACWGREWEWKATLPESRWHTQAGSEVSGG